MCFTRTNLEKELTYTNMSQVQSMENTSEQPALSKRDIFYYRQRMKNRIFTAIASFFATEAECHRITKREIANRLGCDPAQITRWLSAPSNMTLDTISDLLVALKAEADVQIVSFEAKAKPNYVHPLIANLSPRTVKADNSKAKEVTEATFPAIGLAVVQVNRFLAVTTEGSVIPTSAPRTETKDVKAWPTIHQQTPRPYPLLQGSGTPNTAQYIPIPT
jgi:transcriptional regulator with XRE-family HTH domain